MTTILLMIWSFVQWGMISAHDVKSVEWKVTEESQLEIKGTTNVNKFQCANMEYAGGDRLIEYRDPTNGDVRWDGEIVVMARNFDCFNPIMTKDFLKTVMEEDHPRIKIKFLQLHKKSRDSQLQGTAEITFAGISRKFPINCSMIALEDGKRELQGSQTFLFSDFGMEPPEKFFGAVKVKDEVSVEFLIYLSQVEV